MIKLNTSFKLNLSKIKTFIEKDSKNRADFFVKELIAKINLIPDMPYRFRKNVVKNNENIRDLIYKGYVVPFFIDGDTIFILDIYKDNLWDDKEI
ncbi:type II toxin-antitoxin system RelE/ParE family toxin [Campylobacter concisus]